MSVLSNLEPKLVFHYFEEICNIPHGSSNTKEISDYLVRFAKERNLEVYQDDTNNVIIKKPATAGYEKSDAIIIQGHMDMVCEKESDCTIDFEKDGLDLYIDDDFVKAKGTTLGGDDGVAVAYALAILDSNDLEHPDLEVVITVDEEIGMLGAFELDFSKLKGRKMLNIDSDEEGHFLTSCAGGMSLLSHIPVQRNEQTGTLVTLTINGLFGGHSGSEINKERGNASVLMGRLLKRLFDEIPFGIETLAGGLKDNAIPRECMASILIPEDGKNLLDEIVSEVEDELKNEFAFSDPDVKITYETKENITANVLNYPSVSKILFYLRAIPNGVIHQSKIMPNLVETSLNLGIMELKEDELFCETSIRSSVSSRKIDLAERVVLIIEMLGGEVTVEGDYPAWEYCANSNIRPQIEKVYEELFDEKPIFEAIHAGLECGIFSENLPGLDCVSFGPNNFDIHTPKERLSIQSTQKYWKFLVEFLKQSK